MPILNYTTKVPVERTTNEIQKILAKAGAQAILIEFDDEGEMCAISFRTMTPDGMISFRLPAQIEGVWRALKADPKVEPRYKRDYGRARRIAWRILKDWIEAQMALINAEMAELPEVFLPYAQNHLGATMYEFVKQQNFKMLTGPSGE